MNLTEILLYNMYVLWNFCYVFMTSLLEMDFGLQTCIVYPILLRHYCEKWEGWVHKLVTHARCVADFTQTEHPYSICNHFQMKLISYLWLVWCISVLCPYFSFYGIFCHANELDLFIIVHTCTIIIKSGVFFISVKIRSIYLLILLNMCKSLLCTVRVHNAININLSNIAYHSRSAQQLQVLCILDAMSECICVEMLPSAK